MQRELDILEHWAIISGMKLNQSKCCRLWLGGSNAWPRSQLGEERLESSPTGRDLRMLVGSRLQKRQLCSQAAKRVSHLLGHIKQSMARQSKEGIVLLCSALVQPQLGTVLGPTTAEGCQRP